jgi:hypothetical protein
MIIFAVLLLAIVGAASAIDHRRDRRLEGSRSADGFALVDLLVVGMAASTAAALMVVVFNSFRWL